MPFPWTIAKRCAIIKVAFWKCLFHFDPRALIVDVGMKTWKWQQTVHYLVLELIFEILLFVCLKDLLLSFPPHRGSQGGLEPFKIQ